MLVIPEYPEWIGYLRTWTSDLYARSGYGMSGPAPLSYATIESWARLTNQQPTPDDVAALILLDRAYASPGEEEDDGG